MYFYLANVFKSAKSLQLVKFAIIKSSLYRFYIWHQNSEWLLVKLKTILGDNVLLHHLCVCLCLSQHGLALVIAGLFV